MEGQKQEGQTEESQGAPQGEPQTTDPVDGGGTASDASAQPPPPPGVPEPESTPDPNVGAAPEAQAEKERPPFPAEEIPNEAKGIFLTFYKELLDRGQIPPAPGLPKCLS